MLFFFILSGAKILMIWRVRKLAKSSDIETIRSFVRKVYIFDGIVCLCATVLYAISDPWWPAFVFLALLASSIWNFKYPDVLLRVDIIMGRYTKNLFATEFEKSRIQSEHKRDSDLDISNAAYLPTILNRFRDNGYDIQHDVIHNHQKFGFVAKSKRFRTEFMGLWETFYIVTEFTHIDAETLRKYSSVCRSYANRHKLLPFLPLTGGVFCCPVIIAENIDHSAVQVLQDDGPRVSIGFTTFPVIVDLQIAKPLYSDKTPFRGTLVLDEGRQNIDFLFA